MALPRDSFTDSLKAPPNATLGVRIFRISECRFHLPQKNQYWKALSTLNQLLGEFLSVYNRLFHIR